ncbi:hypothetical protein C0J52_18864 [Blattella germanica]|nr:hypothetical protein C0J52_18864 [Blattella germanica]
MLVMFILQYMHIPTFLIYCIYFLIYLFLVALATKVLLRLVIVTELVSYIVL